MYLHQIANGYSHTPSGDCKSNTGIRQWADTKAIHFSYLSQQLVPSLAGQLEHPHSRLEKPCFVRGEAEQLISWWPIPVEPAQKGVYARMHTQIYSRALCDVYH